MKLAGTPIKLALSLVIIAAIIVGVLLIFQPSLLPYWFTLLVIIFTGVGSVALIGNGVRMLGLGKKSANKTWHHGVTQIILGACIFLVIAFTAILTMGIVINPVLEISATAKPLADGVRQLPGAKEYCTNATGGLMGREEYDDFIIVNENKDTLQTIIKLLNREGYKQLSITTSQSETKNKIYTDTNPYDDLVGAGSTTIKAGVSDAMNNADADVYTAGSKITPYCGTPQQVTVPQGKQLIELKVSKASQTH